MTHCYLIYAGGTFGSYGVPLSTLESRIFLPAFLKHYPNLIPIDNALIKDSSGFCPHDFLAFYELIIKAHHQGADRFVIISGTDTLAYFSAFLGYALAELPLSVVIVASMRPFFIPTQTPLIPDSTSDATNNVNQAIDFLNQPNTGVHVSIANFCYPSHNLQKIHSHSPNAFVSTYNDNQTITQMASHPPHLDDDFVLYSVYCLPNDPTAHIKQLTPLLTASPTAVIIIGFGAGNLPYSDKFAKLLNRLCERGFLVVMTTACAFGGVSESYDAGVWAYQAGVLSGGSDTIATLYAKCLWLCATNPPSQRRTKWVQR